MSEILFYYKGKCQIEATPFKDEDSKLNSFSL